MPRFFVTGQAKKHGGQFDNWANCQLSGNMCVGHSGNTSKCSMGRAQSCDTYMMVYRGALRACGRIIRGREGGHTHLSRVRQWLEYPIPIRL